MAMEVFVFHVEAFQFSKFHENVGKLHKGNLERFNHDIQRSKIRKINGKSDLKFCKLIFRG